MKNKTSDLASNEECRKVWEISDAQATINHGYSLELIDPNCIMRVNSCFVEELTLDDVSLKSQHENICNKDALNCKNTMKLSNIQSVELENAIESAEGKGGKFVMPRSMASPFRSPITPNVANLKVRIEDRVSSKLLKAEEKSIRMLDANVAAASYIKNSSDIDMDNGHMARQKRRSSVAAEIRIKRQIEEDTKASKNDDFVKSPFELMFCGISKPKKLPLKIQSEASIFDIFNIRASILQDRTNSPRKSGVFKHKCISDEDKMLNSRFFLNEDPSIEASRQDCAESVGENQSILEHNDTFE
ncbi:uncharacterized protein VICG_00161 [Vittaforma corneae ATCC 50505]|uniref:Uncharacterized protein n=1 Tax=Vittaforma corneae (strain ATCC 50505) TaxID=993615 RepID=L2GPS7_VITCO|nr:uncharacterized protein VICG_00161 [Vittaforma corneae ATCC 50505]ELA42846.1 hypothetical protein VICG_00161 [Vittaforma corneae ATCC 50505]